MIACKDIRSALTEKLRQVFPDVPVFFNSNADANGDYLYCELSARKTPCDATYYDRMLRLEIQFVPLPDARGRISRAKLYAAIDALDKAVLPVFQIGDRYITILESSSRIVGEVLHYTFTLDFTDFAPGELVDLMEDLALSWQLS